jgi:hypothetical protein
MHPDAHCVRSLADGCLGRALGQHPRDRVHVVSGQHAGLREEQTVDRVVRCRRPVDQVLGDIVVGAKRYYRGYGAQSQPLGRVQPGPARG